MVTSTWIISLSSAVVGGAIAALPVYLSERRTNNRFDAAAQTNALRIGAESLKDALIPAAGLISAMAYCVSQEYEETGETPEEKYLRLLAQYNSKNDAFGMNAGAMIVDPRVGAFEPLMVTAQTLWKEFMYLRGAGKMTGPEDKNYARIRDGFSALVSTFAVESREMLATLNTPVMSSDIGKRRRNRFR
jgi:hypothetical protein